MPSGHPDTRFWQTEGDWAGTGTTAAGVDDMPGTRVTQKRRPVRAAGDVTGKAATAAAGVGAGSSSGKGDRNGGA